MPGNSKGLRAPSFTATLERLANWINPRWSRKASARAVLEAWDRAHAGYAKARAQHHGQALAWEALRDATSARLRAEVRR